MFPLNSNDQYVDTNGKRHLLSELFEGSKHDIEELEETVSGHTTQIGAIQDQISPDEYSEDVSYTVGDYVIHGNKLYKCNTSCTADTWENNSQYFTETSVAEEFGNVEDEIAGLIPKITIAVNTTDTWAQIGNLVYDQIKNIDISKYPNTAIVIETTNSCLKHVFQSKESDGTYVFSRLFYGISSNLMTVPYMILKENDTKCKVVTMNSTPSISITDFSDGVTNAISCIVYLR